MPTYIDYHPELPPIPKEAGVQMAKNIKAGKRDQFGVRAINVFVGSGEGYCVTDAPDAESVIASHKAIGFPLHKKNVKQVTPLV